MPVYIRKGPLEIPPGSERDWANEDEEEDYFLKDPDKALDYLPQPYRMIDKVLNLLMDQVWESVVTKEQHREAEKLKMKINIHQPAAEIHITRRVNCMAAGSAGMYIFAGLSEGVAVYDMSDMKQICEWEATKIEICYISVCHVKNQIYLIATIDDMGVARLLCFSGDNISVLKVINEPEDISKRTVCVQFEIAHGGEHAGVILEGSQESWLEVYRLHKDSWLKELEQSQTFTTTVTATAKLPPMGNMPNVETKFTPPMLVMKIKSPKPLTGCSFKNLQEAVQKNEDSCVFGTGQNHIISSEQWQQQEAIFKGIFEKYLDLEGPRIADGERSRHTSFCFLQPNRILHGESERTQTALPNAISVHWNGCHNLFTYLLGLPVKDKSDVDPKPDIVWPCAAAITCSAVSSCTSYLALGLEYGTVTVWDIKYSGFPLGAIAVPEGKFIGSLYFLEYPACNRDPPAVPKAQVLVWCTDKSLYLISAAGGKETSLVVLRESLENSEEQISAVVPVPSLPNAIILFYRSGIVELMDVSLREAVCQFRLPLSHWLAFPWHPVYTLGSDNLCLYLKGNVKVTTGDKLAAGDGACSLFCFSLNDLPLVKSFRKTQQFAELSSHCLPWEQKCKMLLQKRLQCFPERTKQIAETWARLKKQASPLIH
ncbi:WD repeat-containing protein 93 [Spea bombifrons]|uniref:WD repeat-containing protein 93 n=1 Tax=Spea bombifrons TaxID=233779 RepID=UPI00234B2441|nr:WD repeat-containing protein 93 [Spea bombifrons]